MRSRKIIAAVMAPVCAVSAMALAASAANSSSAVSIDLELKWDDTQHGYVPGVGAFQKINITKPTSVDGSKVASVKITVESNAIQDPQYIKATFIASGASDPSAWLQADYTAATKDDDGNFVFDIPLALTESNNKIEGTVGAEEVNWSTIGVAFDNFASGKWDDDVKQWVETPDNPITATIIGIQFLDEDGNDLDTAKDDSGSGTSDKEVVVKFENSEKVTTETNKQYGTLTVSPQYSASELDLQLDDKIAITIAAPEGINTSGWSVAAQGFTTEWGGWTSVSSSAGVLRLNTTVKAIMNANNIKDIADFGGFAVQVWGVEAPGTDPVEYTVDYEIKVTSEKEPDDENSDSSNSGTSDTESSNSGTSDTESGNSGTSDTESGNSGTSDTESGNSGTSDTESGNSGTSGTENSGSGEDNSGNGNAGTGDNQSNNPTGSNAGANNNGGTENPPTGIALGLAPVILAGAAVVVASKKRK